MQEPLPSPKPIPSGVVSLLDLPHEAEVLALWDELERMFGVHAVRDRVPYPHFSYHVAMRYDSERLDAALRRIAAQTAPFTVYAEGLALFTGAAPVLYVPVVRDAALSGFHATLWNELAAVSTEAQAYYRLEVWMAHITLAQGDLTGTNLPAIVGLLASRPLHMTVTVNNLAYIYYEPDGRAACRRYDFCR